MTARWPAPERASPAIPAISMPCNCAPASSGCEVTPAGADAALAALLELDPLSHFARFERYLRGQGARQGLHRVNPQRVAARDLPRTGRLVSRCRLDTEAAKVLDLAPPTAEVLYWLAYLRRDTNLLARAEAASPEFVFPFRPEAIPIFTWAARAAPGLAAQLLPRAHPLAPRRTARGPPAPRRLR